MPDVIVWAVAIGPLALAIAGLRRRPAGPAAPPPRRTGGTAARPGSGSDLLSGLWGRRAVRPALTAIAGSSPR